jgi:hypothetical protein
LNFEDNLFVNISNACFFLFNAFEERFRDCIIVDFRTAK